MILERIGVTSLMTVGGNVAVTSADRPYRNRGGGVRNASRVYIWRRRTAVQPEASPSVRSVRLTSVRSVARSVTGLLTARYTTLRPTLTDLTSPARDRIARWADMVFGEEAVAIAMSPEAMPSGREWASSRKTSSLTGCDSAARTATACCFFTPSF